MAGKEHGDVPRYQDPLAESAAYPSREVCERVEWDDDGHPARPESDGEDWGVEGGEEGEVEPCHNGCGVCG